MTEPRWPVITGAIAGTGLGAVGVWSLLDHADDTNPAVTVRWLVGLALAHDLLLVPSLLVVGGVVRRWSPPGPRPFLAAGLLVSGVLALVAWPFVRGYGRLPNHPSLLPRDYGEGLGIALGAVWSMVLVLWALRRRLRRSPS